MKRTETSLAEGCADKRSASIGQRVFGWCQFTTAVTGSMVRMKKTLHVDEDLLRDAKTACGAKTDTDTIRRGLDMLVRHGAYERLRALRGAEPRARGIRRRRERASAKRSAA